MHRDLRALVTGDGLAERTYRLGRLRLRVRSNGLEEVDRYLHPDHRVHADGADWTVTFVRAPAWAIHGSLWAEQSPTYRGGRLRAGHYLGHHVGRATLAVRLGTRDDAYVGEDVGRLFWTFFLKYALTVHHLALGVLHIKAAAVAIDDRAVVLAGRGGSGKTELALALAADGALIANTHCLVEDGRVEGVATAIRARRADGEDWIAPTETRWRFAPARVAAIALLDRGLGAGEVRRIDREHGVAVAAEFVGATNNWDLKEDVADFAGSLPCAAGFFVRERRLVESLFVAAPCFLVGTASAPHGVEASRRAIARLAEAV